MVFFSLNSTGSALEGQRNDENAKLCCDATLFCGPAIEDQQPLFFRLDRDDFSKDVFIRLKLIADFVSLGVESFHVVWAYWTAVEKVLPIANMMEMLWYCDESNKIHIMLGGGKRRILFAVGRDVTIL